MQTEQLLFWSGVTDTEHTTSGSNEEDKMHNISVSLNNFFNWLSMHKGRLHNIAKNDP